MEQTLRAISGQRLYNIWMQSPELIASPLNALMVLRVSP